MGLLLSESHLFFSFSIPGGRSTTVFVHIRSHLNGPATCLGPLGHKPRPWSEQVPIRECIQRLAHMWHLRQRSSLRACKDDMYREVAALTSWLASDIRISVGSVERSEHGWSTL